MFAGSEICAAPLKRPIYGVGLLTILEGWRDGNAYW
jgi:hypothetical protein